jgi:hypothetical protein
MQMVRGRTKGESLAPNAGYYTDKEVFSNWWLRLRIGSNIDERLYTNELQFPSVERVIDTSVASNFCAQKRLGLLYHRFTSQLREKF